MSDNSDLQNVEETSGEDPIEVFSPSRHEAILTTIKAYQTIYDQITGKQQKIRKRIHFKYEIGFPQLDQLNIKVGQLQRQYHIVSNNCLVSVMHQNDDEEVFDSYEKFSAYNASNIHPVIAINLTYNFSTLSQESKSIKNYSLNVRIVPGTVPPDELAEKFRVLRYAGASMYIEMEYSDYVVARTFVENVSDWAEGCRISHSDKSLKKLNRYSDYIAAFIKYASLAGLVWFIYSRADTIVPAPDATLNTLFGNGLLVAMVLFLAYRGLNHFSERIEIGIDMLGRSPKITLNEGDRRLNEKLEKRRLKNVGQILWNIVLSVLTGVIGTLLVGLLFGTSPT